jgi:hypothetical protein
MPIIAWVIKIISVNLIALIAGPFDGEVLVLMIAIHSSVVHQEYLFSTSVMLTENVFGTHTIYDKKHDFDQDIVCT